jgi:hypothetical protein
MLIVSRVQQLLRLAYAHVQMMLYRPFIHYVSQKSCTGKAIDERSYACAAACVSVSRNVVHITTEMKRRGLLIGAYWLPRTQTSQDLRRFWQMQMTEKMPLKVSPRGVKLQIDAQLL